MPNEWLNWLLWDSNDIMPHISIYNNWWQNTRWVTSNLSQHGEHSLHLHQVLEWVCAVQLDLPSVSHVGLHAGDPPDVEDVAWSPQLELVHLRPCSSIQSQEWSPLQVCPLVFSQKGELEWACEDMLPGTWGQGFTCATLSFQTFLVNGWERWGWGWFGWWRY